MIVSYRNESNKIKDILLGVDFGETNIGIALGRNGLVSPLRVVSGKNVQNAISEISRLAQENHVDMIVVGLPLTGSGKETQMSIKTRKFAKLLKIFTKKHVELFDEFLSTTEAIEESITKGVPQKKRSLIDHISAALILKRYYSENED
jgi:putative Holliday junction resolvase